jgi:hypothetical protein
MYSKLKPLVGNNRQWVHFSNYLDTLIEIYQTTLEQSKDNVEILRAQGSISVLRKVKRLREEVSNLDG